VARRLFEAHTIGAIVWALSVRRTIMRHGWIMTPIETVFFVAGIALLISGGWWLTSAQ